MGHAVAVRNGSRGRGEVSRRESHHLVGAWLLSLRSDKTREAYAVDLRGFFDLVEGNLLGAERIHIDAYAEQLAQSGYADSTIARKLAAVASFYRYLEQTGKVDRSPATGVNRPRVSEESNTLGLDREEVRAFLTAAEEGSESDYAIACLLALNGLRVSEVVGADVKDLDSIRGHATLSITRKRGKKATRSLAPRTAGAIERLLDGRESGAIFQKEGKRLTRHQVARIVARLAKAAGIEGRITPHSLRHSFVTLALDSGASLRDVQDAAGHADPRTTRRYDLARYSLDRDPTYSVAAFVS